MLLRVGPGFRLLVGRDIRELTAIRQVLRRASFYGITLTLALALIGGVLLAVSAERRLAEINRTTRQIMAGDLSRRAPLKGSDDEHDELAQNINAMLDQIENLLEGMRHVGDSVAHDLRGPITRLRNRLETVAAAEQPEPRRPRRLRRAARPSARDVQRAAAHRARRVRRLPQRVHDRRSCSRSCATSASSIRPRPRSGT